MNVGKKSSISLQWYSKLVFILMVNLYNNISMLIIIINIVRVYFNNSDSLIVEFRVLARSSISLLGLFVKLSFLFLFPVRGLTVVFLPFLMFWQDRVLLQFVNRELYSFDNLFIDVYVY